MGKSIAYFQFRAGMGGHFFLRTLFWRYGYSKKPQANSYWNEYHFPIELWEHPDFKRIPWDNEDGEKWYDWETGEFTEYKPIRVEHYLRTSDVPHQIKHNVTKDAFILEHGLYPSFSKTFENVFDIPCPTFTISTQDIEVAKFCRTIRDIKSDCKNYFGIRETTPEANKIREREVWVEHGPAIKEMVQQTTYNEQQNDHLWKQCQLEKEHSDHYLDYQKLCNGSKEPWQLIDEVFKKEPVVLHAEVENLCQEYHRTSIRGTQNSSMV